MIYRTLYFLIYSIYFKIASCDIYVTSSKRNNDWKQAMCTKDIFSNQFTGKYALPPHILELVTVLSLATGKLGILQWRTETQKQKSNFDAKLVSKHVHKSVLQDRRKYSFPLWIHLKAWRTLSCFRQNLTCLHFCGTLCLINIQYTKIPFIYIFIGKCYILGALNWLARSQIFQIKRPRFECINSPC